MKSAGNKTIDISVDEGRVEYTERWLSLLEPILKYNGSMYVCCD